jgi:2-keto-4-pentenoate hydratase
MTSLNFDPEHPAARLAQAARTGTRLIDLPETERPRSLDDAYVVQDLFVGQLDDPIVGWKIAGASPAGLRGELPTPAVIGCLTRSRVFESGATVSLPAGAVPTLETEVAVRFAEDVTPEMVAFDPAMIDKAYVAIEVVCSRFVDRKAVSYPSFVGDNAGFHAFVIGDELAWSPEARFDEDAGFWCGDERFAASLTGDKRTQPLVSLGFLWKEFARRGIIIPKGAIVTTGTLSVPVDTARAGHLEARLGSARVALSFA